MYSKYILKTFLFLKTFKNSRKRKNTEHREQPDIREMFKKGKSGLTPKKTKEILKLMFFIFYHFEKVCQ